MGHFMESQTWEGTSSTRLATVDHPTTATEPDRAGSARADGWGDRPTGELHEGFVIGGKYRITEIVGRGGMGVVHVARHVRLDELVAIKVLRPAMMDVPGMVARFMREGRASSRIKSKHVARVTDVDTLPSGVPFLVMEYLKGVDLAALRRKAGRLPIADAVTHVAEACDAIAEAHSLGIVHRDLKPSNLFLAEDRDDRRVLKVLDFGISKMDRLEDEDITNPDLIMGSPRFMAPEQMRSMRDVDGRSDIWALGAILYDLLAGRAPFEAHRIARLCALVLHGEPPKLRALRPEIPEELEAIVARCMRKAPSDRFATAADLARALAPFCAPGSVRSLPLLVGPASTRGAGAQVAPSRPGAEDAPVVEPPDAAAPPPSASTGREAVRHEDVKLSMRSRVLLACVLAVAGCLGAPVALNAALAEAPARLVGPAPDARVGLVAPPPPEPAAPARSAPSPDQRSERPSEVTPEAAPAPPPASAPARTRKVAKPRKKPAALRPAKGADPFAGSRL